ncbi:hypothetical protein AVEN_49578-1 [Araneus ventricosus]|uniref:Uncharacterized protein n=1 Tax=Araneus ventricosus TaxID=182803 RepID=A0A4Y2J167_ARAVE|nr:hypothetical protein AVEN_49578-1 [Araneus ventricosus]
MASLAGTWVGSSVQRLLSLHPLVQLPVASEHGDMRPRVYTKLLSSSFICIHLRFSCLNGISRGHGRVLAYDDALLSTSHPVPVYCLLSIHPVQLPCNGIRRRGMGGGLSITILSLVYPYGSVAVMASGTGTWDGVLYNDTV